MSAINFASFTVQKSANERASLAGVKRGQNFKAKFRKFLSGKTGEQKVETIYTLSNDKFAEMGLNENGIIQIISPEGVPYIAVVPNENATMLKRTDKLAKDAEKGKKFKSTILDKALMSAGIIEDKTDETQYLDFVKVEGSENTVLGNFTAVAIYEVVKAEKQEGEDEDESKSEGLTEGTTDGTTVDAPQASMETLQAPSQEADATDDF